MLAAPRFTIIDLGGEGVREGEGEWEGDSPEATAAPAPADGRVLDLDSCHGGDARLDALPGGLEPLAQGGGLVGGFPGRRQPQRPLQSPGRCPGTR